jgi:hypothetical protein
LPSAATDDADLVLVEVAGRTFTVPPISRWSVKTILALEDGQAGALIRDLVGDNWEALVGDLPFTDVADAIAQASGFTSHPE